MAETKQAKAPSFTSPKGVFKFPRLNEADTKFNDAGEYSVKLVLTKAEAKPLIDKLEPIHEEAITAGEEKFKELKPAAKKKLGQLTSNDFYVEEYDADEKETGNLLFNFKMTATGTSKKTGKDWTRRPAIFDAKGKAIVKAPSIWSGTVGKVSFEVTPYFNAAAGAAGISLRLNAVQIIELKSGGNKSAAEHGFGEEEGYSSMDDEAPADDAATDAPAGADASGEADF